MDYSLFLNSRILEKFVVVFFLVPFGKKVEFYSGRSGSSLEALWPFRRQARLAFSELLTRVALTSRRSPRFARTWLPRATRATSNVALQASNNNRERRIISRNDLERCYSLFSLAISTMPAFDSFEAAAAPSILVETNFCP